MITDEQYVRLSLELNLFFLRIVKEHTIFAAASLPAKYVHTSMQFILMKKNLEKLLSRTLTLSQGKISKEVMDSSELVTPLTLPAEKATQLLTGIPIDTSITVRENELGYRILYKNPSNITQTVSMLNNEIIRVVNAAVNFQSNVLKQILSCKAFSYTYPLNLEHVTREAKAYLSMLSSLQNRQDQKMTESSFIQMQLFWNDIMGEHAKFIRGYLDPSEAALFSTANEFAKKFDALQAATKAKASSPAAPTDAVMQNTYDLVAQLRDFKRQATQGLVACKIKSIMSPLLADHVTREANYYLRLLKNK